MKPLNLIFLFLALTLLCFGQNKVLIVGKVVDQTGQSLQDVNIRLLLSGSNDLYTTTDISGAFTFTNIVKNGSYIISGKKDKYLDKTDIYYHDTSKSKDTAFIFFSLRERIAATITTSQIGKKDLNITIEAALKKFKIDTTEAILQVEPPGVARGIEAELGDSTIIYLQIDRKESWRFDFNHILNEKVTGIGLVFTNCKTKVWGTGFVWWGIRNPYCKPKKL